MFGQKERDRKRGGKRKKREEKRRGKGLGGERRPRCCTVLSGKKKS